MKEEEEKLINPEVFEEVGKLKENQIATMHNKLIEARYSYTKEEQRLVLVLVSLIEPHDEDFKHYMIPVKILYDLIGSKRKDIYETVKKTIEGILKKPIKIEFINEEGKKQFKMFNFIRYGEYIEGEGYFIVGIAPELKPYLLKLKERFTKIPLEIVLRLRSKYAIRLYELLKQYENTGFRVDYLPDLREMLGVEPEEYKDFRDLEKKVLKVAVKEINEKTDLQVNYMKKKTGRRITHIEFYFSLKSEYKNKQKNVGQGNTIETIKKLSQTFAIQRRKMKTLKPTEEKWKSIARIRKDYEGVLLELLPKLKRLNENQVLFLFINADRTAFDDDLIKEIILKADKNKNLNNPMGFLIKALFIDMKKANYKELTLTDKKIDKELFAKKLEDKFIEGRPATNMIKAYWNENVKGKMNKQNAKMLREPLLNAIYDDLGNVIYVPAPDEVYKDWLEENFLDDFKEFFRERFGVDDVIIETVDLEEIKRERQ